MRGCQRMKGAVGLSSDDLLESAASAERTPGAAFAAGLDDDSAAESSAAFAAESSADFAAHLGATLREERQRARLTQHELARAAGTTQSTVARIEGASRSASVGLVARLFAALGRQLKVTVEPLHADLDREIAAMLEVPIAARIAEARIVEFAEDFAPVPHVFAGATAALLQGAPVPPGPIEVAMRWRDADAFLSWLGPRYGQRWHRHYDEYGYLDPDPRKPGEHRWRILRNIIIQGHFADELPTAIEVRHGDRLFQVVPLVEVQIDDPALARLLRRYRQLRERERG